jgi:hypothetical protein
MNSVGIGMACWGTLILRVGKGSANLGIRVFASFGFGGLRPSFDNLTAAVSVGYLPLVTLSGTYRNLAEDFVHDKIDIVS